MRFIQTAIAAALCLIASVASAGPADDAVAAYERADYATALRLAFALRGADEAVGLRLLGQMHWTGRGLRHDARDAAGYLGAAASAGDATAAAMLRDVPVLAALSVESTQLAARLTPLAEQGDRVAQWALAEYYRLPYYDVANAMRWYQASAAQDYAPAALSLGSMYGSGFGGAMNADEAEALRLYTKAVDLGDGVAMAAFAIFHQRGLLGQPISPEASLAWRLRAVAAGYHDPEIAIARAYTDGNGAPQNLPEAARWLRLATDHGDPVAAEQLARVYREGAGVPQDAAAAIALYRKLYDEQGVDTVVVPLAELYAEKGSLPESARWYRIAAIAGDRDAIGIVAGLYATGKGVARDFVEAARYDALFEAADYDVRFNGAVHRVLRMPIAEAIIFNEAREAHHLGGPIEGCTRMIDVAPSRLLAHYGAICNQTAGDQRTPVAVCSDTDLNRYAVRMIDAPMKGEDLATFVLANCFGG